MKNDADRAAEMWRVLFGRSVRQINEARLLVEGFLNANDKPDLNSALLALQISLQNDGAISVSAANEIAELAKEQLLAAERDEKLRRFAVHNGNWLPANVELELRKLVGLES